MRDFEERTTWHKAPLLALLAAGILTGGAWEMMANARVDIPAAPDAVAEPENVLVRVREVPTIPPPPRPESPVVPSEAREGISEAPTFTPFTVAPSILNRNEVVRAMEGAYPAELRDAGLGGTVRVYFFINAEGVVERTLIDRKSPYAELDAAALDVAGVYRFSPALNKDSPVPVWVSFPITFQVR